MRQMSFSDVSTSGSVPGLGAYPAGDAEAIRATAAALRRVAGTLGVVPQPSVGGWQSPAASRIRAQLTGAAAAAHRHAGEVRGSADALERAADTLEADQRQWRLAKWRMELAEQ
ncbi:hypothetical protein OHA72_23215 [Dactylosporangium sp. NBC_01737]|uniref:hypothetical protein n=1 Tax=Dactylosporangium sp. NBC_01737 TaxID=2975959 RepID=UPI002E15960A|nr:hypothetical protein OHA72_23215 [Dactylosporangium sp. NBC_01737]